MTQELPLLIEPAAFAALTDRDAVTLISFCSRETHAEHHIPGTRCLPYSAILRGDGHVGGLLPDANAFHALLQELGITADTTVVAYDEEGGGYAARLVWTLHAFGHRKASVINGGFVAWLQESLPVDTNPPPTVTPSDYAPALLGNNVIEADEIMRRLGEEDFALLDARSDVEYTGEGAVSERGGRIPGAKHFEWTDAMDRENGLRLKPDSQLRQRLTELALTEEKEIVVYCQTHHRSALSYLMLLHLGYPNVRGYHGAWSDWGNRHDTPVETG